MPRVRGAAHSRHRAVTPPRHSAYRGNETVNNPANAGTRVDTDVLPNGAGAPLIFISHDTRDADLAEAFSKLLRSVSANMIKTFRSSDKKAGDGVDFGDEWYRRLMEKLQATSDVVCLFTERSLDRPWLLFEAGVAKGRLNTPVIGIALGVPLDRVTTGPFYQFQNMDDSEADLIKLVEQLAKRVPGIEPDFDVVRTQVRVFKETEAALLKSLAASPAKSVPDEEQEESPFAKVIEELKTLPMRVAERLSESGEPIRRRRARRFHPMMFDELMHGIGDSGDPVSILMAASVVRDDMPWFYELALDAYRVARTGDWEAIEREIKRFRMFSESVAQGTFLEEFGYFTKDSYMFLMEFPRMLERVLRHSRILAGPVRGELTKKK